MNKLYWWEFILTVTECYVPLISDFDRLKFEILQRTLEEIIACSNHLGNSSRVLYLELSAD